MSIKIRVLQIKRGLLARLVAAGILPGEPAIAWDDDTKPRLLIGDRMGVPRELASPAHSHVIEDVTGLQSALDAKAWAGGEVSWGQLVDLPASFPPPVASDAVLGGVKAGSGVSITPAGVLTVAFAAAAGTVAWGNVSGRPSTLSAFANDAGYLTGINGAMVTAALGFTPAAVGHTHAMADVSGLPGALAAKADLVDGRLPTAQLPGRATASVSTPSLAPGATAMVEIELSKTTEVLTVATTSPAEVHLYNTAAARAADASRASTQPPAAGSGLVCQNTTTAGALSINQDPVPTFANHDSPVAATAYLSITNKDTVARAITVSITHLPKE